jgi:HK97 family phage prohead protease
MRPKPGMAARLRERADSPPVMHGHFAVFDSWTEINDIFEGQFLERIAPGAFRKTFRERGDRIRVLFQHGQDDQVGSKPLGPIQELREDNLGAYYEVKLLDTSYARDLLPGLEAGLYGASFAFTTIKEEVLMRPKKTAANPAALTEVTLTELKVHEFGPVTFPAYATATADVRSTHTATSSAGSEPIQQSASFSRKGPVTQLRDAEKRGDFEAARALAALTRGERVELVWGTSSPQQVRSWRVVPTSHQLPRRSTTEPAWRLP